jgi:hypothetical protein
MDAEEFEAAVNELVEELEGEPGDRHEIFLRFKQMLDQMRAMGMPIPDDLAELESGLDAEFTQEGGGKP